MNNNLALCILGIIFLFAIMGICLIPNSPRIIIEPNEPSFHIAEVEFDVHSTVEASLVRRSLGFFIVTALLDAIEYVESRGDVNAIGDNGQAVGCMQIHPIMVKDINRILGRSKYTLDDRYNRIKSRQMCKIYINHYCKDMNLDDMAACWVAGPDGYLQKDNLIVKKYLEKINNYLVNLQ